MDLLVWVSKSLTIITTRLYNMTQRITYVKLIQYVTAHYLAIKILTVWGKKCCT